MRILLLPFIRGEPHGQEGFSVISKNDYAAWNTGTRNHMPDKTKYIQRNEPEETCLLRREPGESGKWRHPLDRDVREPCFETLNYSVVIWFIQYICKLLTYQHDVRADLRVANWLMTAAPLARRPTENHERRYRVLLE